MLSDFSYHAKGRKYFSVLTKVKPHLCWLKCPEGKWNFTKIKLGMLPVQLNHLRLETGGSHVQKHSLVIWHAEFSQGAQSLEKN